MEELTVSKTDEYIEDEQWSEERKPSSLSVLIKHHELIRSLVFRDIRSRYKQSVLGIAWALIQPLAMMLVYTIVFSRIANIKSGDIPYPLFSYISLLAWMFFSQGLTTGTECLVSNFNLITKIYFPREAFPITSIIGKTVDLGLGAIVSIPLFIIYDVHITWLVLLVLPVLVIQTCFTLGLALILSSINVFYRDIRHVVPLLLQVWMYLTPIVYPLSMVPKKYQLLYNLNPMASIVDTYHRVVLQGKAPIWEYLAIGSVISILTLIVGYRIFKKLEPAFAEII